MIRALILAASAMALAMGVAAPEVCAMICEIFTGVDMPPIKWLAKDAYLGPIQVILQGLAQGFCVPEFFETFT